MRTVHLEFHSNQLLEIWIDFIFKSHSDFFVVFATPLFAVFSVDHNLAHVVGRARHLIVLEGHAVELAHVLLNLGLA